MNEDNRTTLAISVPMLLGGVLIGILLAFEDLIGPEWLSALTSLLLVVIGAAGLYVAPRNRMRAQAELVSAWPEHWRYLHELEGFDAFVLNNSRQAIYSVGVKLMPINWPAETEPIVHRMIGVIPPGNESEPVGMPPLNGPKRKSRHGGNLSMPPPVEIEFYDANGRRWRRDPDGVLTKSNWMLSGE